MAPSLNHRISIHEDKALFREAVLFTAGDFFDIYYLVSRNKLDLKDMHLFELLAEKLKVPGNAPIDVSAARKEKLKAQINTELKPVLRPMDFESFDLDKAFDIVLEMSKQLI